MVLLVGIMSLVFIMSTGDSFQFTDSSIYSTKNNQKFMSHLYPFQQMFDLENVVKLRSVFILFIHCANMLVVIVVSDYEIKDRGQVQKNY